jgi:hypothetical protein
VPSDTFSHAVTIPTDRAVIGAALEQADTWKGLGPIDTVWDARFEGERLAGFRWSARAAGKTFEGTADRIGIEEVEPMRLNLESSDVTGTITVDLATEGAGSTMTVTMTVQSKSFMAGMFWGIISDALRTGLPDQVDAFAAQF